MVAPLPDFKLVFPETIDHAVAALAEDETAKLCAGGTDLIVNMRHGLGEAKTLVDISRIGKLKELVFDDNGLRIGAGVTLAELTQNSDLKTSFRVIHQACLGVAGPSHRTRATVGGNLCLDTRCLFYNQSHWWRKSNDYCLKYRGDICHVAPKGNRCRAAFTGDLAPALIACQAEVDIIGPQGRRTIKLKNLYREDGADHLALAPGEIITTILVKSSAPNSAYQKIRIRGAIDFPLAGVGVVCNQTSGGGQSFSIAITGTNSSPVIIDTPELDRHDNLDAFFKALSSLVKKAVSPQRTTTTGPHYRRLSVAALTVRIAKSLSAKELSNGA